MLKTIYITLIALLIVPTLVFSQKKKEDSNLMKTARKEYVALRYAPAIKLLERELKEQPEDIEAQQMIADSYRNIKNYDKAVYWYAKLTQSQTLKPQWALNYAEALANKQEYSGSEQWYQKYLELVTNDNRATSFSKTYPEIDAFLRNRKDWTISYLNINTAASEYSPLYYKKGLIFSSNRKPGVLVKKVFGWDQTPFSDLYEVKNRMDIRAVNMDSLRYAIRRDIQTKGQKKYKPNDDDTPPTANDTHTQGNYNPKFLNDTLGDYLAAQVKAEPVMGNVNTPYHEGSAALLPDGSLMFTRNNYYKGKYEQSKDGINKLKIFTAKAPNWEKIEPFIYNNDQYSVGHPALNKAGTVLIFASDKPGGYGGTDLYYCKRATINSEWEQPVNMGPVINTEGNELFPTLYKDSTFYFSSTGHPGLGGLDIFQVALSDLKPLHNPINIGSPVNSSVDDFGLIRSDDGKHGFFTSNRKGSDDIYSFLHKEFQIKLHGTIVDAQTGEPICYSTALIKPYGLKDLEPDMPCSFGSLLQPETDYHITATNYGFSTASIDISTKGIHTDTTINVVLKITGIKHPFDTGKDAASPGFNCDSVRKTLTIYKIYYDLDKSFIRADAQVKMAKLIKLMNEHPELKLLIASYCDSRESKAYNMALSLRRSQAAKDYLIEKGIDASRIFTEHFGENNLVTDCPDDVPCSEEQHQLNRRSEFSIIKGGKKVLSMNCGWLENAFDKQAVK